MSVFSTSPCRMRLPILLRCGLGVLCKLQPLEISALAHSQGAHLTYAKIPGLLARC